MSAAGSTISIRVLGTFRITGPDETDCTPTGRKTCALMALLALAPDKRRTRTWVQNRLWGTRGKEQASASLRQALAEARRALGEAQGVLVADKVFIRLDAARVSVDFDAETFGQMMANQPARDLLEGLEIGYEDFDDWLIEQRRFLADRRALPRTGAGPLATPHVAGAHAHRSATGRLVFQPFRGEAGLRAGVDTVLDGIGRSIREIGVARVVDQRAGLPGMDGPPPGGEGEQLVLASEALGSGGEAEVRLALSAKETGELLWSSVIPAAALGRHSPANARLLQQINEAVGAAADRFMLPASPQPDSWSAAALCQEGIRTLFRLGRANYDMADRLFARAFDLDGRGIYLAWRAYLRTFLIAERQYTCRKTIEEEAFAFLRHALEKDPHNSYVLALGAHVHTILRRNYMNAFEFAERSVAVNPSNPIGWACLGVSKCHLGQSEDGFRDTQLARSIAGWSPTRFQLDALSCIAGSMAGKLDEAIHMGEASHALAPEFAAPMRYLVALHLISGNYQRSQEIVDRLKLAEPDFSYDRLREKDYPAAGLQRSTLIRQLPQRQI